jgi:transcriptional regulator with XRE-family HTH domain
MHDSIKVNTIMQNKSQKTDIQGNKIMLDSISERVNALILAEGLSEGEFSRKLGHKSNSIINRIRSGKVQPSFETLLMIVEAFNVDANWLVTGRGEMYLSNKAQSSGALSALRKMNAEGLINVINELNERVSKIESSQASAGS